MSRECKPTAVELDLRDELSDLLTGFRVWRESKVGHGEWTDKDEMFARWVEAKHDA